MIVQLIFSTTSQTQRLSINYAAGGLLRKARPMGERQEVLPESSLRQRRQRAYADQPSLVSFPHTSVGSLRA